MSYNSAIDKIDKIDVDKNDVDKIFTFDNINNKRHNGKHITMIEISPKEKYLITYSKKDRSIVGWNVENIDKVQLKFHQTVNINEYGINGLCVSDDKKLAYIIKNSTFKHTITVIDMNYKDKKIALNLDIQKSFYVDDLWDLYCTFNLKGEFIIYSACYVQGIYDNHKIIWIYSTQTKNNKWKCKRFYRIPEDYELISISKHDKVYLVSNENDYIYEWSINTNKSVKIFVNNKDRTYKFKTKNIGIFSNEELIFLKINDKIIIVYSIELEIPIASLDINDVSSYSQIDNDGNINSSPFMFQIPDKNTNMFIDIRTSLFAMYLFLTGDSSALFNWPYADNPSIAILIVLFSLLIVIYLMNLLIGLLSNAIEEDNNRVSYLMQKAE
ncbi:hypothetical protein RhiirC2_871032, partial [Rhizophagus irregularis]